MGHLHGIDGQHGCQASGKEHAGQGHNKGLDLQITDQEALSDAKSQADAKRQQQRHQNTQCTVLNTGSVQV